jgi:glycosyltransferase involved in cell wall biosynthesis
MAHRRGRNAVLSPSFLSFIAIMLATNTEERVSVVIPAYNEENALASVIASIRSCLEKSSIEHEIVVVVDGATDRTEQEARAAADKVLVHPQNCGYGRSLKTGIAAASNNRIVITDADGTYPIDRIPDLLKLLGSFDMVVGARSGKFYRGGIVKRMGRVVFRYLSEYATGQRIPDINSGLRVFRKNQIMPFFPLINSGFSFTTTSTLSYLLNDLLIAYVPIEYHKRHGTSKVHHIRDSLRALQIIMEAILRCNPIKAFLLLAMPFVAFAFLSLPIGMMFNSHIVSLAGWIALCTSGVIVGLGFLAVALQPTKSERFPVNRLGSE